MLFHNPSSLSVITFSVSQKTHFDCSTANSAHAIPNFYIPFPTYENELSSCILLPRPGIFSCRVFLPVSWALPATTFSCGRLLPSAESMAAAPGAYRGTVLNLFGICDQKAGIGTSCMKTPSMNRRTRVKNRVSETGFCVRRRRFRPDGRSLPRKRLSSKRCPRSDCEGTFRFQQRAT